MQVPDLADPVGPVTERNCTGAIPPGGKPLEVNDPSVTPGLQAEVQSELDSVGGFGEPASETARATNKLERPALREWTLLVGNRRGLETAGSEV